MPQSSPGRCVLCAGTGVLSGQHRVEDLPPRMRMGDAVITPPPGVTSVHIRQTCPECRGTGRAPAKR